LSYTPEGEMASLGTCLSQVNAQNVGS